MPSDYDSGFSRAVERICDALLYVGTFAGALLTALVALSAFMRYLVGKPFAFTEELVGLLFVVMVFSSLPYCTIHRRHIEVTLVTERMSPRGRRFAGYAAALLTLLFCAWFGTFAWEFVATTFRLKSRTDFGGLPLWPWMAMMLVSLALIALATVALWRRRRLEQGKGSAGV